MIDSIADYISKDDEIVNLKKTIDNIKALHKRELNRIKRVDNAIIGKAVDKCKAYYLKKIKSASVVNNRLKRKVERLARNHILMQSKANKYKNTSLRRKAKIDTIIKANEALKIKIGLISNDDNKAIKERIKNLVISKNKLRSSLATAKNSARIWREKKETTVKAFALLKMEGFTSLPNQFLADRCFVDVRHFNNTISRLRLS